MKNIKNNSIIILILLTLLFFFSFFCRSSGSDSSNSKPDIIKKDVIEKSEDENILFYDKNLIENNYNENQQEFPGDGDDSFFKSEPIASEVFRVLIAEGNYQFRQISKKKYIRRKKDPNGDRSQVDFFNNFTRKYNFQDFIFRGTLKIRLNPHSGEIELIKYIEGKTPQASQVTKYFKDDLSRFAFSFPLNSVVLREFHVSYEWRIKRRDGLTDEHAKQLIIEFLKTQKVE